MRRKSSPPLPALLSVSGGSLKISAIIPTYNRRTHVIRAVESVLAQSEPVDEIIVVDDGSTDGTCEEVRRHFGSSVRVLTQENKGVSAARNHGIREAHGEWIAFLDSDDVWLPTKIELQIKALATAVDGKPGLCFSDNAFDGDPGMSLGRFHQTRFDATTRFGTLDQPAAYIVGWRNPFVTSSILVDGSQLSDSGGFDEALVIGEDVDLIFRLGFRTTFCFVAEQLVRMDRDPNRGLGLEKLLATREDRRYDSIERMYVKWLAMPEVAGTPYEQPIRELLRQDYYSSVEAKIHEFRIGPALRRINRLRDLGDSYALIAFRLFTRKLEKLFGGSIGFRSHVRP